jgi:hypothetical protein
MFPRSTFYDKIDNVTAMSMNLPASQIARRCGMRKKIILAALLVSLVSLGLTGCFTMAPQPPPPPISPAPPSTSPSQPMPALEPASVPPQRIQYDMPAGCVSRSSVSYSNYLDAGEQISGLVQLTGISYSTDWSYEWEFHILGPGGESMDDWTGHYVNSPRHYFNCTASYAGTYTIRVSHVSCYRKTLVIEVTPPGWGYSGK